MNGKANSTIIVFFALSIFLIFIILFFNISFDTFII